jgi:NADPH2:quinone reductase
VDLIIDYKNNDFEKILRKEGWGGKLDAVFDSVGGISVRKGIGLLNAGGSMVLYGGSRLTDSKNPFHQLRVAIGFGIWSPVILMMRSISFIGVNMLRIADNKPELLHHCLSNVVNLYNEGVFKPEVGSQYSVDNLAEAHDFLESGNSTGKIVVNWDI